MRAFKATVLVSALISSAILPSMGDIVIHDEATMVKEAEVIAVVNFDTPRENPSAGDRADSGEMWRYSIVAAAKTLSLLKGTLPKSFDFFGGEDSSCGSCVPSKGRFLVFLRKDGKKWVGANWQFSLRPIKDGKINWYERGEKLKFSLQDEAEVMARVKEQIAK
jgi:hypothetical protein